MGGPSCNWSNIVSGPSSSKVRVTYLTEGQGLKTVYGQRDTYTYFRELPQIEGQPAVAAATDSGQPEQSGKCSVDVGVSDDLSFTTQFTALDGPDKADPCGKAQQVAGEVVKTLQAGA